MREHRQILASVIDEIIAMDPDCSILLVGSLARGEERDDSDIDLHVCMSREPECFNDLIGEHNYEHMHVCTERNGVKIDIGWRLLDKLEREWTQPIPVGVHYYFMVGKCIRDPSGGQTRWLSIQWRWLEERPWLKAIGTYFHDQLLSEELGLLWWNYKVFHGGGLGVFRRRFGRSGPLAHQLEMESRTRPRVRGLGCGIFLEGIYHE